MLAPVLRATMSVIMTWCFLMTGSSTAMAQALCPDADAPSFAVGFLRAPGTITVEVDLRAFGATPPGGTWHMSSSGGVDGDRRLSLGASTDVVLHCEAKSVSRTFSITDRDFVSFFVKGRIPRLQVGRTTAGY